VKHPFSAEVRGAITLTWTLALREIRAQYNRTALGRLWSLVNPLVTIATYSLVFGLILAGQAPPGINSKLHFFALWIAVGLVTWTFLSSSIAAGMSALLGNSGLLTKVHFPRVVLVISAVIAKAATFLTELSVIMVIVAAIVGPKIFLMIPLLVVFIILLAVFCTGVALTLSIVVIWFRDIEHLWGLFSQVWMYASGVVFPVTLVASASTRLFQDGISINGQPIPLLAVFRANPAEQFIEAFRALIYDFALPNWDTWLMTTLWACGSLTIGTLVFRAKQARIVEEL